jgi:hypothetical protein
MFCRAGYVPRLRCAWLHSAVLYCTAQCCSTAQEERPSEAVVPGRPVDQEFIWCFFFT